MSPEPLTPEQEVLKLRGALIAMQRRCDEVAKENQRLRLQVSSLNDSLKGFQRRRGMR